MSFGPDVRNTPRHRLIGPSCQSLRDLYGRTFHSKHNHNKALTFVIKSFTALSFTILDYPFSGVGSTISVSSLHVHFFRNHISLSRLMNDTDRVDSDGFRKFVTNEVFPSSSVVPSIWKPVGAALIVKRTSGIVTKVTRTGKRFVEVWCWEGMLSVLACVELDLIDYPGPWKVTLIYYSPELVSFSEDKWNIQKIGSTR